MFAALLSPVAAAALVQSTYCADHDNDFVDLATGDYRDADVGAALGVRFKFTNEDVPNDVVYAYAEWQGAGRGCAVVELNNAYEWTVAMMRQAQVDGLTIQVQTAGGGAIITQVDADLVPSQAAVYPYEIGPSDSVNVLDAASFALSRRTVGVTGETIVFVMDDCPSSSGFSCYQHSTEKIFVDADDADYKFTVARLLGEYLADAATGFTGWAIDDSAPVNRCSQAYTDAHWWMNSKEFNSMAVVKGLASFYAAMAFNDDTVAFGACDFYMKLAQDWDADSDTTGAEDTNIFDCGGSFAAGGFTVVSADYIGEQDSLLFADVCHSTGASANRGTAYDWMRTFWSLRSVHGRSGAEIFDIFVAAVPDTWSPDGIGTGPNAPSTRMHTGAFDAGGSGLQTDFDGWASFHGTNR